MAEARDFLFSTVSRLALEPTQHPVSWVQGTLTSGLKWPGREADHTPPYSAKVKNMCRSIHLHDMVLN
jgi:hypothetical protein